ncbi:hypothetical protein SAMN05421835_104206 [Amycolatopsis sacchari]|uniref:Uncharacterized protein n=1 Tax=Amycolatopsis sacchari TaxID=115433 RepID=A0A1I3Q6S1_9PSEU|nr:hypothetical protein SAMN05421835_104206 [Amycolatopsis sacchari]
MTARSARTTPVRRLAVVGVTAIAAAGFSLPPP